MPHVYLGFAARWMDKHKLPGNKKGTGDTEVNSSKIWDSVALFLGLLISLTVVASLTQLLVGGEVLDTFSKLTLRIINILFALSIVLMILIVVLENGSPANTLAWVMVLIFIPVIGFIFYLFFGRNWRKRRVFTIKSADDTDTFEAFRYAKSMPEGLQPQLEIVTKLSRLLANSGKAALSFRNRITLLADTTEAFGEIIKGIDLARHHIYLEYFSVEDDAAGSALKDALVAKAAEGIQVFFIYDDVGCWKLSRAYKQEMIKAGIRFVPFMPVWIPFLNSRLNYRNHRKLVVVDGRIAYLGGLNIGDRYLGKNRYFGYWRDSLAIIEGEGARALQAIFLADWKFVYKRKGKAVPELVQNPNPEDMIPAQVTPLQVVASGPDSDQAGIMQLFFAAISSAQRSICISTPYLILNESLRMALKTAAGSGVKVQIVLPAKADHFMVYWASRSYFSDLMEVGIELWEYQKGFNHAKIMIIDEGILLIGSANMDLRSFHHNFELTAAIYGVETCAVAKKQFLDDLAVSSKLDPQLFKQRSMWQKSKESLCRLVSPLL